MRGGKPMALQEGSSVRESTHFLDLKGGGGPKELKWRLCVAASGLTMYGNFDLRELDTFAWAEVANRYSTAARSV